MLTEYKSISEGKGLLFSPRATRLGWGLELRSLIVKDNEKGLDLVLKQAYYSTKSNQPQFGGSLESAAFSD